MDAILWVMLPLLTSAGSALLAFFIMQARLEVALAKEREELVMARANLSNFEKNLEAHVRATEEETKRKSMDQFLSEFRVEERHYTRENKSLFLKKKSMVLQERLYFRNLPLSNWVEHEMTVEEGGDMQALAKACSVFSTRPVSNADADAALAMAGATRLLR